jgi:P-type E1-E2 ATPase
MANAVVKAALDKDLQHEEMHTKVNYVIAHGGASTIGGEDVYIGSWHFVSEDLGCKVPDGEEYKLDQLSDSYSHLYLAIGKEIAAIIEIEDPLKEGIQKLICDLHDYGFKKIVMLTGDNEKTAGVIASLAGVDEYKAQLLPLDKANYIKQEKEKGSRVVMVGDGVNDSPALSEADVGIAVTSGAAIAREIADVTIAADNLGSLVELKKLSTALMQRISLNYKGIVGFNSLLMILGMTGLMRPQTTALLHNVSTVAIGVKNTTNLIKE